MSTMTPPHSSVTALSRRAVFAQVFGHEVPVAASAYRRGQWLSVEEIELHQWRALTDLLQHARRFSPFYHERLAPLDLDEGLSLTLFRTIPPLTRSDIETRWPEIRTRRARPLGLRRRSGGSGGRSVAVPLDRSAYLWYLGGTWRGLQWWGVHPSEPGVFLTGSANTGWAKVAARVKDWALNWRRVPVDPQFDQKTEAVLAYIRRSSPAYLYGYPSALHRLARAARSTGWSPPASLKVIVLSGEPLYAFQRRDIGEAFRVPTAVEYGSGELGSMAFECPDRTLHVTAENVFLEVVPASAGSPFGRIYATQLRNRIFPLIRYDTEDLGAIRADTCRCGRGLPSIRIGGRAGDTLAVSNGRIPAGEVVERLYGVLPDAFSGRVQAVQTGRASLTLRVEPSVEPLEAEKLAASCRSALGGEWDVQVSSVGRLVRLPSGKLPYFLRLG